MTGWEATWVRCRLHIQPRENVKTSWAGKRGRGLYKARKRRGERDCRERVLAVSGLREGSRKTSKENNRKESLHGL